MLFACRNCCQVHVKGLPFFSKSDVQNRTYSLANSVPVLLIMSCVNSFREILVTNECLARGGGTTPMPKKNQSGSLEAQLASLRQLSSLGLMTRFWKMTSAGPSGQGNERSL